MAHYVDVIIAIRTSGVLSQVDDLKLKNILVEIAKNMEKEDHWLGGGLSPVDLEKGHCISKEISGHKGGYVCVGGVVNYGRRDSQIEFARRISEKLGKEVFLTLWDEQSDAVFHEFFLKGKSYSDINEDTVVGIARRFG